MIAAAYTVVALVVAALAYRYWPRQSFEGSWYKSRYLLLGKASRFVCTEHADQLSFALWMLEDVASLGDQKIKKALGLEGRHGKHVWRQLLKRPNKLELLLQKIQDQGFVKAREIELTDFVNTTAMFWRQIKGQDNPGIRWHERTREVGAEQRAPWQHGLPGFGIEVYHEYESKALALTLCKRRACALAAFSFEFVDINTLIEIGGELYRVTKMYRLESGKESVGLMAELYRFATGSSHYLSVDMPGSREYYLSNILGGNLPEFDEPPGELNIGEIKEVLHDGFAIERKYFLAEYGQARLCSTMTGSDVRIARWVSVDGFRIGALWLHERRACWQEWRLDSSRSTIQLVIG